MFRVRVSDGLTSDLQEEMTKQIEDTNVAQYTAALKAKLGTSAHIEIDESSKSINVMKVIME